MTDIFTEKICIVTGGTSGIGLAVSEALLRRGAVVYMADITGENIAAAQEKLKEFPNARFARVDVTRQPENCKPHANLCQRERAAGLSGRQRRCWRDPAV